MNIVTIFLFGFDPCLTLVVDELIHLTLPLLSLFVVATFLRL